MDVMHTDRCTCLGREDPLADSLLRRVGPVLLECAYGEFGESDGTATACGSWSVDVAIEDGPPNLQSTPIQVNISPLEAEQFAVAHPCCYGQCVEGM